MEMSITTRRNFLKAAGLTAASLFLPGCRSNAWLHGGDSQDDSFFFIQMADPQFGMWSTPKLYMLFGWSGNPDLFERETENMIKNELERLMNSSF